MRFILSILLIGCCSISIATPVNHGKGVAGMDKYGYTVWYSGSRFTFPVHSGNPDITQSGTGYTFSTYDTLTCTGAWTNFATIHNITGVGNMIDAYGVTVTNTSFQQLEWHDVDHLTIAGFQFTNYWAEIFMHFFHDNKILDIKGVNNVANRHDQPLFNFDWPYNADMKFTGSISQTFYNDSIIGCKLDGYANAGSIITFGSPWSTTAEINRGIAVTPYFERDTILNNTRNGSGGSVGAIQGTGPGAKFINCAFYSIDGVGSSNNSHNQAIFWYGYIFVDGGGIYNSYASMTRTLPMQWTGLPGYAGSNAFTQIQNTLSKHFLSYSAHEITTQGAGSRTSNGFSFRKSVIIHNTVDSTTGLSYNGPSRYNGKIVDLVDADSVTITGNVIFRPEMDFATTPYSTDSAAHNGYFYAEIGAATTHFTLGTNYSARYSTGKVVDSIFYKPSAGSPMIGGIGAFTNYTQDRYGVPIDSNKGAAAYVTPGVPPNCTTNINATSVTQTSAVLNFNAAAGGPTGYQIWINGVLIDSATSSPHTETGLTANTLISWYVVPYNTFGNATGCSANATTFTTLPNPPNCTTNITPVDGTTLTTANSANLSWNAATGSPTGYNIYIYLFGGSPGSITYTTATTSQTAVGLTQNTHYSYMVVPFNTGGSASGCTGNATSFTTANIVPVTYNSVNIFRQ